MAALILRILREDSALPPTFDHTQSPFGAEVSHVAWGAMHRIARSRPPQVRDDFRGELMRAVLSARGDAWRDTVARMRDAGCALPDVIDLYVPAVARDLGADWVGDRAGFAQVTLGCTRLRRLLAWADLELDDLDFAPSVPHGHVVLITPAGGQHRLGQQLFAAQLMRRGVAARIAGDGEVVRGADVVMISASGQEDTALLRATVARARAMGPAPFVILGGGAVDLARATCLAAGADLVTTALDAAIAVCRERAGAVPVPA